MKYPCIIIIFHSFIRLQDYFYPFNNKYAEFYQHSYNDLNDDYKKISRESTLTSIDSTYSLISKESIPFSGTISDIAISSEALSFEQVLSDQRLPNEKILNEFIINKYLTLKLIKSKNTFKTSIYINNKQFFTCQYLLLNISKDKLRASDNINSIDEAAEYLDHSLEGSNHKIKIDPHMQFIGHCSNLHAWAENNYDTRLLHSNLAFPLLKKLAEVGDPYAKRVFKEEIIDRFLTGITSVQEFLIEDEYFNDFTVSELNCIIIDFDEILKKRFPDIFSQDSISVWFNFI